MIEFVIGLKQFFLHLYNAMQNTFFWIISILAYFVGYPAQESILVACLILFILDIITKFYSIRIQNGGLIKAFLDKKLTSRSFWNGFVTKALGYFIILTIANLAIITPQIKVISGIISTTLYVGLFFYECISNMENLRDSNFLAIIPILNKLKKEQNKFLETDVKEVVKNIVNNDVKSESNSEKGVG